MFKTMRGWGATPLLVLLLAGGPASDAFAQSGAKIKYALGDVVSVDELPLLVAV